MHQIYVIKMTIIDTIIIINYIIYIDDFVIFHLIII